MLKMTKTIRAGSMLHAVPACLKKSHRSRLSVKEALQQNT